MEWGRKFLSSVDDWERLHDRWTIVDKYYVGISLEEGRRTKFPCFVVYGIEYNNTDYGNHLYSVDGVFVSLVDFFERDW